MQAVHTLVKHAAIFSLLAITSCSWDNTPIVRDSASSPVFEATGSTPQRIEQVSARLSKAGSLPTAIEDAHFLQEQLGDGAFGPSDYRDFYGVEVAVQDVEQWSQELTPLQDAPEYAAPPQPRDWWISPDAFTLLQFYQPAPLTGRSTGWIGISQQTGKIYIFTFTT